MKINIWRLITLLFLGLLIGFFSGSYITTKIFLKNLPAGTEMTIGKIRVKGNNNTIAPDFTNKTKQPKKRLFRKKSNNEK